MTADVKLTDPSADLRARARAADDSVLACQIKQCAARERIARQLAKLDAELEPLASASLALEEELRDAESRTVGPWLIDDDKRRYSAATCYVAGEKPEWSVSRAWLRVVVRNERSPSAQWELDMQRLKTGAYQIDTVFGPPDGSADGGFRAVLAASEKLMRQEGYLFAQRVSE